MNIIHRFIEHLRSLRTYPHLPIYWEKFVDKFGCDSMYFPIDDTPIWQFSQLHKQKEKELEPVFKDIELQMDCDTITNAETLEYGKKIVNSRYALADVKGFDSDSLLTFSVDEQ